MTIHSCISHCNFCQAVITVLFLYTTFNKCNTRFLLNRYLKLESHVLLPVGTQGNVLRVLFKHSYSIL